MKSVGIRGYFTTSQATATPGKLIILQITTLLSLMSFSRVRVCVCVTLNYHGNLSSRRGKLFTPHKCVCDKQALHFPSWQDNSQFCYSNCTLWLVGTTVFVRLIPNSNGHCKYWLVHNGRTSCIHEIIKNRRYLEIFNAIQGWAKGVCGGWAAAAAVWQSFSHTFLI